MEDLSELQRLERIQVSCSLFASAHRRRRRYFASLLLIAYSILKTHAYMEVQLNCKAINSKPSLFLRKDKQINRTPRLFMHTHNQISFKRPIVHEHHQQCVLLCSLALEMQTRGLPHAHMFLTFTTSNPASNPI